MLKSQLEWCPGWKFPSYVRLAIAQIELFSSEILKRVPGKNASPRLNKHAEDIIEERYKSVELEPGWIIVGREENGDFIWEAREIKDCQKDLKDLADGMKRELEDRFEKGFNLYATVLFLWLCLQVFLQVTWVIKPTQTRETTCSSVKLHEWTGVVVSSASFFRVRLIFVR